MYKDERAFTTIVVSLVILIIGLVSGIGYYVYQTQQPKDSQANHTVSTTSHSLVQFTDPTKSYTFNYPGDWVVKAQPYREDWSGKIQLTSINYPGGNKGSDPITVSLDATPTQAVSQTQYLEESAKGDPKAYTITSINGYKTLYIHYEWKGFSEDRYLIINKDQSSLYYIVTSKSHNDVTNFDATDKLADFTAIVNSTKFLR